MTSLRGEVFIKTLLACLVVGALSAKTASAQRVSTGTFTAPPHIAALPQSRPQTPATSNSAVAQRRRALIMQQRQERLQFEQQYKAAMQSLETSVKGQSPAQQAMARAQAQQEWRAKRKALLNGQRQARSAMNSQGH